MIRSRDDEAVVVSSTAQVTRERRGDILRWDHSPLLNPRGKNTDSDNRCDLPAQKDAKCNWAGVDSLVTWEHPELGANAGCHLTF